MQIPYTTETMLWPIPLSMLKLTKTVKKEIKRP